jgi:hypothetical protein
MLTPEQNDAIFGPSIRVFRFSQRRLAEARQVLQHSRELGMAVAFVYPEPERGRGREKRERRPKRTGLVQRV